MSTIWLPQIIHLLRLEDPPDWVNVGTGRDCTIRELAETIAEKTGYAGRIDFDTSRPDGTPRKLTDISRIRATGWEPTISLPEGIADTYRDFRERLEAGSLRSA